MSALSIQNLSKTYAGGVEALKDVSLTVEEGDFFALLGPNGAGKSTMIGIISSLVNASSGSVKVFGTDISTHRSAAMRMIGLVPQEANFNQFEKPLEIVVNQAGYYGIARAQAYERAEDLLNRLNLWEKRNVLSRTLSGGMKRRLMIARSMMHQPRLLILDEPTAGVDIEIRRSVWKYIESINTDGTTVILTTHYLEEAEQLCRNIAIIDQGAIVRNTTVKSLLTEIDIETFVLDSVQELNACPEIQGVTTRLRDDGSIEIDLPRGQLLNSVFDDLQRAGIEIRSMRNKSNRLEELFVRMIDHNTQSSANDQRSAATVSLTPTGGVK